MNRSTLITLVFIGISETILLLGLWQWFALQSAQQLTVLRSELTGSHSAVVESYRHLTSVVLRQNIDRLTIRNLLTHIQTTPPDQLPQLRGLLYRELILTYRILRDHHVQSLQIILPSGDSFLRFERPDIITENVSAKRLTVRRAIATRSFQHGFETGMSLPSSRYVYPLLDKEKLIAIIDFGVDTSNTRRRVFASFRNASRNAHQLIVRRDQLDMTPIPDVEKIFRPTVLHPEFVAQIAADVPVFNKHHFDQTGDTALNDWVSQLDNYLGKLTKLHDAIAKKTYFSDYVCVQLNTCFAINLSPIANTENHVIAYSVSYIDAPNYRQDTIYFVLLGCIASLLIIATAFVFKGWLESKQYLHAITEHMAEGLYVVTNNGLIVHVNQAATDILGYARHQLIGQNAHRLFHLHPATVKTDEVLPCILQIAAYSGQILHTEEECFYHRDGHKIHVSLTASPLKSSHQIAGTIVLFRDVTQAYQNQLHLKQADIAFQNFGEALLVTDASVNIQAVNTAFTDITGYTELEVLGKNPRLLSSGQQNDTFYANLWDTLNHHGHWQGEIINRHKNGKLFPAWLKITAVFNEKKHILGYVAICRDLSDLHQKDDLLRDLAQHDQLTTLANRSAFIEKLKETIIIAGQNHQELALLYLDIDRFKRINDTLGHLVGDALLKEIAQRLRTLVNSYSYCARIGGDEFSILINDFYLSGPPSQVAQQILILVREPICIASNDLHITVSIGICLFPQDGTDGISLLKNADAAMYFAKKQGRDSYCYFNPDMATDVARRFTVESSLRRALSENQLRLFYQPKIALSTNRVIGFEALLRWQHPEQGLLAPGHFLDEARDAGLMPALTEWVVHEAARASAEWRAAGLPVGRIACNLDALVLDAGVLKNMLLQAVKSAGITADDLDLEIVETAMSPTTQTSQFWHDLVAAGFKLAIDDFGTGESSLARLKELPVNALKIDRRFVRDIEQDGNDRAIVRTIVAMAKALGIETIAEGVETQAQLDFLRELGADAAQGYFISHPMPAIEVAEFVKKHLTNST
ncbi:EAL domain-containing protein [Rhodoferax sp. 4810]|uniref:EAL domain-containing protein n=1 Tax=Thiospirillum jenense TaxID=1653858 RepID=A0A839HBP7_9GAMM|nr:EAL domain-containing protein [Thiospirillum jenense]MBB1073496.1 EAL domain-containing protein [Rhodoferax jenense]MBB1125984.1 EAL domain-containing protein [Thiospirillum jenense]